MKKNYIKPAFELVAFEFTDIISASEVDWYKCPFCKGPCICGYTEYEDWH